MSSGIQYLPNSCYFNKQNSDPPFHPVLFACEKCVQLISDKTRDKMLDTFMSMCDCVHCHDHPTHPTVVTLTNSGLQIPSIITEKSYFGFIKLNLIMFHQKAGFQYLYDPKYNDNCGRNEESLLGCIRSSGL